MKKTLLITSSPRGEASLSSRVALDIARRIGGELTVKELWKSPLPQIGPEFVQAVFTPSDFRSEQQQALVEPSDQAVRELLDTDTLIIGAAMINFSLPAALKTWIDYVSRAGVTFRYTENGPVGLVTGKKAILVLATGGVYSEPPMKEFDHLEPVLRTQLGFLGITDVETIWIQGTMLGPGAEERSLDQANERVEALFAAA